MDWERASWRADCWMIKFRVCGSMLLSVSEIQSVNVCRPLQQHTFSQPTWADSYHNWYRKHSHVGLGVVYILYQNKVMRQCLWFSSTVVNRWRVRSQCLCLLKMSQCAKGTKLYIFSRVSGLYPWWKYICHDSSHSNFTSRGLLSIFPFFGAALSA